MFPPGHAVRHLQVDPNNLLVAPVVMPPNTQDRSIVAHTNAIAQPSSPAPSHLSGSPHHLVHNSPNSTIKSLSTACPPLHEWLELPDDLPKQHAHYADEQVHTWKYVLLWYFLNIVAQYPTKLRQL